MAPDFSIGFGLIIETCELARTYLPISFFVVFYINHAKSDLVSPMGGLDRRLAFFRPKTAQISGFSAGHIWLRVWLIVALPGAFAGDCLGFGWDYRLGVS